VVPGHPDSTWASDMLDRARSPVEMSDADRGIARQIALRGKRTDALLVTASTAVLRVGNSPYDIIK
jgi:hypothetical protein